MFKYEQYDAYEVADDFQLELPIDKFSLNPQAPTFIPKGPPRPYSKYRHYRGHSDGYLGYNGGRDHGGHMGDYLFRDSFHGRDMYRPAQTSHNGQSNHKQIKRNGKQRKYSYRSKQNKINVVLNNLKRKFSNNGKLAHGEVLRGEDTLRIDVKRFTALQQIEKVIDDIERNPNVEIVKADFPVSQKNRFQKKGFIAYLKCGSSEQANLLHEELKVMIDPKWQDKNLFRINIALDQQKETSEDLGPQSSGEESNNESTPSEDTESTNSSLESGEKEVKDRDLEIELMVHEGVWVHSSDGDNPLKKVDLEEHPELNPQDKRIGEKERNPPKMEQNN